MSAESTWSTARTLAERYSEFRRTEVEPMLERHNHVEDDEQKQLLRPHKHGRRRGPVRKSVDRAGP